MDLLRILFCTHLPPSSRKERTRMEKRGEGKVNGKWKADQLHQKKETVMLGELSLLTKKT
jgi:hypothetical protein